MRHAQALDEHGSFWKAGRWWWGPFHSEWVYRLQGRWAFSIGVGGGDSNRDVALHLSTPLFSWFLTAEAPRRLVEWMLPYHWFEFQGQRHKMTEEREWSLSWHSGGFWWRFWMNPNEWNSADSRWRRGHFDPRNFFFGQARYEERILSEQRVLIPMPERAYAATVQLREDSWKRPRWPWRKYLRRAQITPDEGLPSQGKGENSWDCGDDATYGLTCPARTLEEAIGKMVECVYRERLKYGICAPDQAVKA